MQSTVFKPVPFQHMQRPCAHMVLIQNWMEKHQRHHFENKTMREEKRERASLRFVLFLQQISRSHLLTQPVPGDSRSLMWEPCPGSVPSPRRGHRPHGFWEMVFKCSQTVGSVKPSGLRVDIRRQLGSWEGQMKIERGSALEG